MFISVRARVVPALSARSPGVTRAIAFRLAGLDSRRVDTADRSRAIRLSADVMAFGVRNVPAFRCVYSRMRAAAQVVLANIRGGPARTNERAADIPGAPGMIAYRYRIIPGLPGMIARDPAMIADIPGMIAGLPAMIAYRY
jgi:hypothetical protein